VTLPTQREIIDRVIADDRSAFHTSFPARVLAYDVEAQTVDVRPALLREVPSDDPGVPWGFEQLPDILSAQVMWPRAGGFVITFPIAVGDWVLVLCAEQATSLWRTRAQAPSHPGLVDPHGLNGCVCLPGWYPDKERLANVSATDLVIGKTDGDSTIAIKPDGTIQLGDLTATPVALSGLVETAIAAALVGHSHASLGGPGAVLAPYVPLSTAATKVRAK
jgi:Phage protein Gp138 N-terminal domain